MKQLLIIFCIINCSISFTSAQKLEKKDITDYISKYRYTTIFYLDSVQVNDLELNKISPQNRIIVASLIKPPSSYSPIKYVMFLETDSFIKNREARLREYVQGKNKMHDAIKEFLLLEMVIGIYFDNLEIEPN